MFVFPAFNSEFKNRKRTFKCCKLCRLRRIKCKLSTDYEKHGCDNCILNSLECDLMGAPTAPRPLAAPMANHPPVASLPITATDRAGGPAVGPLIPSKELARTGFVFTSDDESARALHFVGTLDPTFLFAQFNATNDPRMAPIINGTARRPFLKRTANEAEPAASPKRTQIAVDENLVRQTTKDTLRRSVGVYIDNNEVQTGLLPILFEYLNSIEAFTLHLSPTTTLNLLKIYFYKVNVIFPLLDEKDFWSLHERNCVPTVLQYAIVMVAARDPEAQPLLVSEGFHDPKHFTSLVETKIRSFILFNVELNQLTLCRTYALLSMHERASINGTDKLSTDLAMAIHIAISLGIHHKNAFRKSTDMASQQKLWWTIFVLDRLNAIVNTRNMSVHRKDISVSPPKGDGLAQLVLVALRLEKVLSLYQPHGDTRVVPRDVDTDDTSGTVELPEVVYPEEQLVVPCYEAPQAQREAYVARASRNVRALLNNIIIILAQKRAYENPAIAGSIPDAFNATAASKLLTLLNTEADRYLPNTPLLPYAGSIVLTAFLRVGCLRVLGDGYTWREPVRILSRLSHYWWNAGRIAEMSLFFFRNLEICKALKLEVITTDQRRDMWKERDTPTNAGAASYNNNAMNPPMAVNKEPLLVPVASLFDTPPEATMPAEAPGDADFSLYQAIASQFEPDASAMADTKLDNLNGAYSSLFELLPDVGSILGNFDYELVLNSLEGLEEGTDIVKSNPA